MTSITVQYCKFDLCFLLQMTDMFLILFSWFFTLGWDCSSDSH